MSAFPQTRFEREVRDRDPTDHFVYLIGRLNDMFEVCGPVKVGISKSPLKRLSQLQTGCHDRLVLISRHAFWKRRHAEIVERAFHETMAFHRLNGEWFDLSVPTACAALAKAVGQFIDNYLQPVGPEQYFTAADYSSRPGFDIALEVIDFEFPK